VGVTGLGFAHERERWDAGDFFVAGLDESGRGSWAGPVVAGAVVFPPDCPELAVTLSQVRDSKALTPLGRERLFPLICETALAAGVGMASSTFIDAWGIMKATRQAMGMALRNLGLVPDYLLVDALELPDPKVPQMSLIKGDAGVLSIAAASIVAKVFRDRVMMALDQYQPGYGFALHKGYGTPFHRSALERLGPCAVHRLSFAPMRFM
jgi:ribonuclease HII